MQQGFFTKKETASVSRPDGKTYSCVSCGRYKNCISARMKPYGNFKKGILNIGEYPSKFDDKACMPFQDKAGKFLQRTYKKLGIDLFEDCLSTTAVQCYSDTEPTNYEIDCCRRRILQLIKEHQPKVIVLFGMIAVYSVIGHRWKKDLGGITKWRGWTIPDQDLQTWICPVFTPDFVLENDMGAEETIWKNDLKQVKELLWEDANTTYKFPIYKEPEIEIIEDLSVLSAIKNTFAFDYETTGLKPHAQGHKIVCCAVADTEDHAYVFMIPKTKKELQPLIDLLEDENIGKVAQNMKFEKTWTEVRLRTEVKHFVWDTMLASHLLDNRTGVTGLAFQTYINFGVIDFKDDTDAYLKPKIENSANDFNQIMNLLIIPNGKNTLLKRCALDAVFELRLANKQRELIILPF